MSKATRVLSVYECAALSEDVYADLPGSLASDLGFSAFHQKSGGDGFFGRVYLRGDLAVFAIRGTSITDLGDMRANFSMAPSKYFGAQKLPSSQTKSALEFFDTAVRCMVTSNYVVTGHSLGGALTKAISLNRSVMSGVAFNAPFVGGLGGVNKSMLNIINVNTVGDPVSENSNSAADYFMIGRTYNVPVFQGGAGALDKHSIVALRKHLCSASAVGGMSATKHW